MTAQALDPLAEALGKPRPTEDRLEQARQFIELFYSEQPDRGDVTERVRQVVREIESSGTYWHTAPELAFAAQVAWRNSSRCIGRLYWRSLRVRDRRHLSSAASLARESAAHLREATNSGRIRPLITVFAPDTPGRSGPCIISPQLVSYAGHEESNEQNGMIGDPANAALTRLARKLGWPGPATPGPFDILPLIIAGAGAEPSWHELPPDAVLEVPLQHPTYSWFADLGLRWYAVPVISNMVLDAGGIRYPAAPFNGWYMCTEIGSRDLGDVGRYNLLPRVASMMELDTSDEKTLWKDRAITELNQAVLYSFSLANVRIADHHTESARFLKHLESERAHGRSCPADWSWIVPPTAASSTPVFHHYYTDFDQRPNFYRRHSEAFILRLQLEREPPPVACS
jgi:nitric-oxide synthase, bacterial